MSVVVVGTLAFDSIETPFGAANRILGGSGVYIALSARFFYRDVCVVAVVGGDFPDEHVAKLADRGIDLSGLEVVPDGKTFEWAGRYHFDLNDRDTLATHLNVLTDFQPVVPAPFRDQPIVCLGNLDPSIQMSVVEQVSKPRYVVMDTMNYWIENTADQLAKAFALADCLIVNDAEARQISGESNLIRAARVIRDLGPETIVIKKGEHGALLFTDDSIFSAPAYPLEDIFDPTGAGDAFMGGFVGCLAAADSLDVDSLKRAVICGSAVASYCVERFGPDRLLEVTHADIDRRIDSFRQLSEIPTMSLVYAD
jgi:sugar/nucleoside kinase (ribokinase family)